MPVPDHVIFGPDEKGEGVTYGQVRGFSTSEQLTALRRRLNEWLIAQTDTIGNKSAEGRAPYAPFPVAVMTCIGIETLGQILFGDPKGAIDKRARMVFTKALILFDQRFSRKLTKVFKSECEQRWTGMEVDKIKDVASLIYYLFRNTMMHGYTARGVYLTEEISDWKLSDGTVELNPYWFWNAFKGAFHRSFAAIEKAQDNNPRRRACLAYIERMLN